MMQEIERASILLYDVQFTGEGRINGNTKHAIARALKPFPALSKRLPKTWTLQKKDKKKRKARTR